MKKKIFKIFTIMALFFVTACDDDSVEPGSGDDSKGADVAYEETFVPFVPYQALEEDLLDQIEASGFEGTDEEIANQILAWQSSHMQYIGDPNVQADISHPMRWNYMIPGIFPVSEMVVERVLSNGKIYGLCWDYASIYGAIANSYGLEVRITALKKYLSDINPSIDASTHEGLSEEEYEELNEKLKSNDVEFKYGQIDRVAKETWVHYRAEVKINGEWKTMDGVEVTGEYATGTFEVVPFDEGYNNVLLYAPSTMENMIVDVEALAELLGYAPVKGYEGITDDNGDENRAANFTDLIRGRGLVPYYTDLEEVAAYLNLPDSVAEEMAEDAMEVTEGYEGETGKKFYAIADAMIFSETEEDEEVPAEKYLRIYNAITGASMTESEFNSYIK